MSSPPDDKNKKMSGQVGYVFCPWPWYFLIRSRRRACPKARSVGLLGETGRGGSGESPDDRVGADKTVGSLIGLAFF